MRLGISSYAYAWAIGVPGSLPEKPMDCRQLLDKAIDLKVDCLQIADNLPLHKLSAEERFYLMDKARANQVNIEVGMRGMTENNMNIYMDLAEYFRSPILRAVIDLDSYQPDIQEVISIIREYLPELKARNISLAIENHDRFKALDFAKIIDSVGDIHVGICLDSVNSMGAGEGMDEVLRILGPYTVNFHIKDFVIKRASHMMGFVVEGKPAGEGMLPLEEIIDKLVNWGQCESAILELWTPPQNDLSKTILLENSWAEKSITNIKKILSL